MGTVSNNGPIDVAGANKATHFVPGMCQPDHPLIGLQNTTGHMVDNASEQAGVIKHGSKPIQAVTSASFSRHMPQTTIHCGGIPMAIGVHTGMLLPALVRFGSSALCKQFLAPSTVGDMVGCIGVFGPSAGSDVPGIKSVARTEGDDDPITGQKMGITNSLQANRMCMLVSTSTSTSQSGAGNSQHKKSLVMAPDAREQPVAQGHRSR